MAKRSTRGRKAGCGKPVRTDVAPDRFERAAKLRPTDPDVMVELGAAYSRNRRWAEAVPVLLKAIELYPDDNPRAVGMLAMCLLRSARVDEAWTCYRELYRADDKDMLSLYLLIFTCLQRCDWEDFDQRLDALCRGLATAGDALDFPLMALAYPGLTASDHLAIARGHALRMLPSLSQPLAGMRLPASDGVRRRLRVGYLSADFRCHPVGFVIPEVIERHDRTAVEVFGYSTGVNDGSAERARLAKAFDRFIDASTDSAGQLASRIRGDRIDILVDLQGWSDNERAEALAFRCAPVQVNWLGYPGTLGHSRLADYILGDAVVTPATHADSYAEAIVHLPGCYMPFDTTRRQRPMPSRAETLLPEAAFVFSSLNTRHKFNPQVFDIWCGILQETPGSVLWLTHPGDEAVLRLRQEAGRRGIDGERLVFAAEVATVADHLARLPLADLALDPFPYNAHSSGADTLWAGVPMITLLGRSFAGRVGASLLGACGLAELVAETPDEYRQLAVQMYRDRERLTAVRTHLADRARHSLFDMSGFVSGLESAYRQIWDQYLSGERKPIYR